MLIAQHITYQHANGDRLFDSVDLTINEHDKAALIGNNGAGKSTLLQILAGVLQPVSGSITIQAAPYYVPQIFGQFNHLTVAEALRIDDKLHALKEILAGNVTDTHLATLNDDWAIEERCSEALAHWGLGGIMLTQQLDSLSGGEKTKVFLAGISIHQPGIILLDEPGNHLDAHGRELLYDHIRSSGKTFVVVSHDRALLDLLSPVFELSSKSIAMYGGSYDLYLEQKAIEQEALDQDLRSKEKELRKAREVERASLERKQKLDARGKKKQDKAGIPTISMNTLRNNAEKSTSRMKDMHAGKVAAISKEVDRLRKEQPAISGMRMGLDDASLHKGKILVTAKDVQFGYDRQLWQHPLSFVIASGDRIAIKGRNGSGKTTLIKLILGDLQPSGGKMERAVARAVYVDQEYALVDDRLTVYEQAQAYNADRLQEHEVKNRLNRYLFTKAYWDKPCAALSGGEKMRLTLCCLTMSDQPPDIIVLDEPTNNLDMQNIAILTAAINTYKGTVVAISHDIYFLKQIDVGRTIELG